MEKSDIMDNILLVPSTMGDLISRLRKLTDINEIAKKHYLLPDRYVPKRNIQKFLKGPL